MKRINRILKNAEFREIVRTTPFLKSHPYVIHYRKNDSFMRIGIQVSKKNNGNAVTRNRIKRQIRAMVAKNADLSKPFDILIVARAAYRTDEFLKNENELIQALKFIGDQN